VVAASFLAPIAANEPWLSSGLAAVGRVAEDLERQGFGRERTVLLGFSQGACLALEYAARSGGAFRAVVGLSGGLVGTADADDGPRRDDLHGHAGKRFDYAESRLDGVPVSWAATSATRTSHSRGCGRPRRCSGRWVLPSRPGSTPAPGTAWSRRRSASCAASSTGGRTRPGSAGQRFMGEA
jgi:pimeloyl-ACP methyl ester carboxylesterase